MSYSNQGVSKPGVVKSDHGIVYIGKVVPQPEPAQTPARNELGMRPFQIRIDPDHPTEKLMPMSRINYGKVYTVEHNVKVRSVGMVNQKSVQALEHQFRLVWNKQERITPEQNASIQGLKTAGFSHEDAMLIFELIKRGHSKERAVALVRNRNEVPRAAGKDTEEAEGEEDTEDAAPKDNPWERAVKTLIKAGKSKKEAIAILRNAHAKSHRQASAGAQQAEDEDEVDDDDDDDKDDSGED